MLFSMRFLRLAAVCGAIAWLPGCGGGEEVKFVTIGTGSQTGVYYPVGSAMATLINAGTTEHGMKASVETTGGSVFNINAVVSGDMDFGIAQADREYQALNGQAEWTETGPLPDLRAVCSLYTEMVNIVAAEDTGARSVADLKGKIVSIGNPGSGQRRNAIDVFTAAGVDWEKDIRAEEVRASDSAKLLQDGRIDAFFFTVGHPAGTFMEASAGRRKVRFIPITGMEALIEAQPFYRNAKIPLHLYDQVTNDEPDGVPTIGVTTMLVTSATKDEAMVYEFTKTLFENLDTLRAQHPALEALDPKEMVTGNTAPHHPGAVRYFKEAGLL